MTVPTSTARAIEYFTKRIRLYREDPVLFVREVCGFEPDTWQHKVLNDLADPECRRVSVRSGQGVGKTCLESVSAAWFLACFPYSRVVATAPTRQQLNDVLWAEIAKWISKSPVLPAVLRWTKTYVYVKGMEKRWFATAKTATKPEAMQGFHEDNMLFIVDEASGVADPIMEAILGTLTGPNNKLLMCGNPTQTTGAFYDSHMNPAMVGLYRTYRVSSRDVARTSKEHIAAMESKYGRESNFIRVRVDGEFPLQDDDVFISHQLLERSVLTEPRKYAAGQKPQTIDIAADIARYGDDKTVIGYKLDEQVVLEHKIHGQDIMTTADRIMELGESLVRRFGWKAEDGIIPVKIDDSGVGGGVTDALRRMKSLDPERFWWMCIVPCLFGTKIKNRYFDDTTTYWMSIVRNLLRTEDEYGNPKPVELILPDDTELIAQLSARKYKITDRSKARVESKEDMKKRSLASPDEADCVLMLCIPLDRERAKRRADRGR